MMLMPCCPRAGPTGGAGDAWPAFAWSFIVVRIFFAIAYQPISQLSDVVSSGACAAGRSGACARPRVGACTDPTIPFPSPPAPARRSNRPLLQLLHLVEADLHWGLAAEDRDEHRQLRRILVDL